MEQQLQLELIQYLSEFVTKERIAVFHRNLNLRTDYITVVLENIYQTQNASAILRTVDCFGIQDVHIIENSNKYVSHPTISLGANKWLTQEIYNQHENNTLACLTKLKSKGYRIVATTPHTTKSIYDLDIRKGKIALLFGAEQDGLSDMAMHLADERLCIPMFGFTESFNLSVAAALCMQSMVKELRTTNTNWQLNEERKSAILLDWLRTSINDVEQIEERFWQNKA